jgi:formylglycine-generating enzyme
VQGGCYKMGSSGDDNALPPHEVCLDGFHMGKYEVTQEEWRKIMGSNPAENQEGKNYPVENVSWHDVKVFLEKLNRLTGRNYRLPTEAQWEYAARERGVAAGWSGTSTEKTLADYAWYKTNSNGKTHEVGHKKPNSLGIYDLTGNVWEWTEDCDNSDADTRLNKNNPVYTGGRCWSAVRRGGSYETKAKEMTDSSRDGHRKGNKSADHGFRIVLPMQGSAQ